MKAYLRLVSYLRPYRKRMTLNFLYALVVAVFSGFSLGMILPFVNVLFDPKYASFSPVPAEAGRFTLTQLKDHAYRWLLQDGQAAGIAKLCLIILVVFFLKNLFAYLHQVQTFYLEQRVIADLRDGIYGHLQRLSLSFFHRNKVGQLVSRLTNDVTLVRGVITDGTLSALKHGCTVLVYLAIVLWASWQLALIALLVLPACIGVIAVIGRKLRKRGHRFQERMADVTAVIAETISGIRLVKTFAAEDWERRKFSRSNEEYFRTLFRFEKLSAMTPPLTELLGVIAGVLIIMAAKRYFMGEQALSPGRFFLFLGAAFSMMQPLNSLSRVNSSIQQGLAAAERLFGILDTRPEVMDSAAGQRVEGFERSIEFRAVSFGYDHHGAPARESRAKPALDGIQLEIARGERLALVGPSGAGKSTLVDLIPRFYDPTSGAVLWDGRDLKTLDAASIRRLIGIVSQETILFHDTVFNNIAYAMTSVSQASVEEAAKAANAHLFISRMPQGYQTVIGERGLKLSGGERQRISIARAILKNPPILIFDEATSALDTESEALVQEAIDHLMANRTAIVIAHRLSTVKRADRIVVLERGRITETGTHDELLARQGTYWRLYNLQFKT